MPNILIAEDDLRLQEFFNVYFGSSEGTTLSIVSSPDEAIQILSQPQEQSFTHAISDGFHKKGWRPVIAAARQHGVKRLLVMSADDIRSEVTAEPDVSFILKGAAESFKELRSFMTEAPTGGSIEQEPR